jgi:hypothetical protein
MVVLVEGSTAPLPAHVYWFLTEPLWVDLVRRVEFDGFARLLEACTAKVGEAGRSGRLVLLTTLVRRAAFRAGDAWLEAAQRELGEAWLQLPPWLQEEVDLAEWLLRYRAERPAFRAAHELRETIDRALVAIVEGDEVRADRAFLAAQVACLDQRDELFEAFPFGARSGCAVEVLLWHADGALARRGGEREPEPAVHRVTEFSRRLVRRTDRSLTGQVRNLLLGILLFASVLLALSSFAVAAHLGAAERPLLWAIPAVTVVLALVAVLRGWFGRLVGRIEGPFVRRMHRLVWRRMTADFLAETHVPVQEVLRVIVAMKKRNANLDDYVEAVSGDEGLFLYSNAIRFAE